MAILRGFDILKRLEEDLQQETSGPDSYLNSAEYMEGLNQFIKVYKANRYPILVDGVIGEAFELISQRKCGKALRICSVGFGGATFEHDLILEITTKFPDIRIEFVGIDTERTCCERGKELLAPLKNVEVTMYNRDFMLELPEEPFDLVLLVHSLYYVKSCEEGVKRILNMISDEGLVFAVLSQEGVMFPPFCLFGRKENPNEVFFSARVSETLDKLKVRYTNKVGYSTHVDLTEAVNDNFSTGKQKSLLDFLVHSTLEYHSDATKQTCIDYFKSVARGTPDKYLIDVVVDFYFIYK